MEIIAVYGENCVKRMEQDKLLIVEAGGTLVFKGLKANGKQVL
jgi:hypothetical protein